MNVRSVKCVRLKCEESECECEMCEVCEERVVMAMSHCDIQ